MFCIACIVEGHGDVAALPVLLRRIAAELRPGLAVDLPKPIRVPRDKLLKAGELERAVEFAARRCGSGGGILLLLDADDDCPKQLVEKLLPRALAVRPGHAIRAVLAKAEYESWFLAAAESIAGHRDIDTGFSAPADPEVPRNPKGRLSVQMPPGRTYKETLDQPALTAVFDMTLARARAPSFDKLWRDVDALLPGQP